MRRLRCRAGLHKWVRVKHEDTDLAEPGAAAEWRTSCRYCGVERRSGLGFMLGLSGALAVGGALVWWLVSPVLGVLLVLGSVLGIGWTASLTLLGRVGSFGFRYRG